MIRRSTWILFLIFVILAAVAFFWERSGKNGQEEIPTATPQASVLDLVMEDIERMEISASLGDKIALVKNESGVWTIDTPQGEVDPEIDLNSKIENFITIRALSVLDTPPPADATGLTQPIYTITLSLSNGSQRILEVGKVTVIGSGYYLQVSGKLYVVDKFNVDNLVDLIENPPYITTEPTASSTEANPPGTLTPTP